MFLSLYKSLVRPHLEYGCNIWSVIYKKEAIAIENVQRRATKLLRSISQLSYSERLKFLGLPTLQYRRLRYDMVETYRILNGIDNVDKDMLPLNNNRTRGHSSKIYKKHCRTNIRKYTFSQRIVDSWNNLPESVVSADSVNSFKSRLNKHWKFLSLKFVATCYEPEAERRRTQLNGSERQSL